MYKTNISIKAAQAKRLENQTSSSKPIPKKKKKIRSCQLIVVETNRDPASKVKISNERGMLRLNKSPKSNVPQSIDNPAARSHRIRNSLRAQTFSLCESNRNIFVQKCLEAFQNNMGQRQDI
ncbi:hypothetical protein IscW_ISCW006572 [Ixodes scapularis]|uniref:Uncharacterized protein n=1 Tax=Ixodes scapularis TaxID=6945 RepID=B7PPS3_IXOSC|nr:hypothetical protein IscW_ISCW006572 [Ixodes scapularis]|eukprot:XP_002435765.1 hypothetical protein IscW_ISCW006572 [Ixodes scapularis]